MEEVIADAKFLKLELTQVRAKMPGGLKLSDREENMRYCAHKARVGVRRHIRQHLFSHRNTLTFYS